MTSVVNALPAVESITVNRSLFDSVMLLVAAAGSLALLVPAVVLSFSRRVRPAPATAEFGPEPPAVVSVILNRGGLSPNAAAATLVDLAARGIIQIEEVGPRLSLVRLRTADPPAAQGMLPHEAMVYGHVRSLATGDVVPTEALGESGRDARRWRRDFVSQVIADAGADQVFRGRPLGLIRVILGVLRSALLVCVGTAMLYTLGTGGRRGPAAGWLAGATLTAVALVCLLMLRRFRLTARGRETASAWLGVRRHLVQEAPFSELPAAAVTRWGRPMAYAIALGLADEAAGSLLVSGPRSRRRVWFQAGGLWRSLGISRSRGAKPAEGLFLFFGIVPFLAAIVCGLTLGAARIVTGRLVLDPILIAAPCLVAVAPYIPILLRALADIVLPRPQVEARILRRQKSVTYKDAADRRRQRDPIAVCSVLLTLPRSRKAQYFGLEEWLHDRLPEGALIKARVAPRSGWVYIAEVVEPGGGP